MEEESHCHLHISFSNLTAFIIAISLNITRPLMHSFYLQYILIMIKNINEIRSSNHFSKNKDRIIELELRCRANSQYLNDVTHQQQMAAERLQCRAVVSHVTVSWRTRKKMLIIYQFISYMGGCYNYSCTAAKTHVDPILSCIQLLSCLACTNFSKNTAYVSFFSMH